MNKPCACNNHNGTICAYHQAMYNDSTGPWRCDPKCINFYDDCYNTTTCGLSIKREDTTDVGENS